MWIRLPANPPTKRDHDRGIFLSKHERSAKFITAECVERLNTTNPDLIRDIHWPSTARNIIGPRDRRSCRTRKSCKSKIRSMNSSSLFLDHEWIPEPDDCISDQQPICELSVLAPRILYICIIGSNTNTRATRFATLKNVRGDECYLRNSLFCLRVTGRHSLFSLRRERTWRISAPRGDSRLWPTARLIAQIIVRDAHAAGKKLMNKHITADAWFIQTTWTPLWRTDRKSILRSL